MSITNSHCPDTLGECANQLGWLTQADGIRQFFDENGAYESSLIFNLFALCEDISGYLMDGDFDKAESIIKIYYRSEMKEILNPISTHYCEKDDMTFIMREHYSVDNVLEKQECIGWYHGSPSKEMTEKYGNSLVANYLE